MTSAGTRPPSAALARAYRQRLAAQLQRLGPRSVFELLDEVIGRYPELAREIHRPCDRPQ